MTIIKVTVEDESAELLKKLLQEVPFVKNVEEEHIVNNNFREPESAYTRIKKMLDDAKGKNLFEDIKDPSEWQRELRKEWDRDF
jgi:hydrogenase maturation factor HypE